MVKAVAASKTTKKVSVKKEAVVAAEPLVKKTASKKSTVASSLEVAVFGIDGKEQGTIALEQSIFGTKVNMDLLAQAVRVYLANQRQGNSSTKTRGEVRGSTRKIYRQKGTGRARHGAIRAPIFVGGGIVFGPKPRDFSLSLPKRMKKAALKSALTLKLNEKNIRVIDGVEKLSGKTSQVAKLLSTMSLTTKAKKANKVLVVLTGVENTFTKAASNIEGLRFERANLLNTYEVLNSNHIIFVRGALETLGKHLSVKE